MWAAWRSARVDSVRAEEDRRESRSVARLERLFESSLWLCHRQISLWVRIANVKGQTHLP